MKENRRHSGQSMVEFALVLPLILLIMVLFVDLGRIIYFHSALKNAVREGARYAVVTQFTSSAERELGIQQKVVNYAVALPVNLNDVIIYCERNPVKLVKDQVEPCAVYVTVYAHIEIQPMLAFVAQFLGAGNTFNVTAESTMQMTPWGAYVE